MRSTAIRFSVPDNSSISRANCSFDRNCGIVFDNDEEPRESGGLLVSPPAFAAPVLSRRRASRASRRCGRRRPAPAARCLHGLYEIRDQIIAALQLVLHLCPLRLDSLLLTDERVVRAASRAENNQCQPDGKACLS
jgi:hypothetical protein